MMHNPLPGATSRHAQIAVFAQPQLQPTLHRRSVTVCAQSQAQTTTDRLRRTAEGWGRSLQHAAAEGSKQAANTIKDQAELADSRWGVRNKLRSLSDETRRQLPKWQRRYQAFLKTTPGKVATWSLVLYLIVSGLAFKLLNLLFIALWILPLLAVPLAQRRQRKAAAQQQRQQAQAPRGFSVDDLLRSMGQRQSAQQTSAAQPPRRSYSDIGRSDGPVIDAEWTTIDEDR